MSITYPNFPNTVFPDAMQTFVKYLDITQSDAAIYDAAVQAMVDGNLMQAQNLLNTIPNIGQKAITAEKLNTLIDTVQALQQFYNTDLSSTLDQYQVTWRNYIDRFKYIGDWQSGTAYLKNSMVSYASTQLGTDQRKYLYIAVKDIQSSTTNPFVDERDNGVQSNWRRLVVKGEQGQSGASQDAVSFRFAWEGNATYNINDIVVYDNDWWVATVDGVLGVPPSLSASQWRLMLSGNLVAQYPVQSAQPADSAQKVGDLWFQLI